MLNEAKQRNLVLSQAYAALHAEYVALKTSQMGGDSSSASGSPYHQPFDPSMVMPSPLPYGTTTTTTAALPHLGDPSTGVATFDLGDPFAPYADLTATTTFTL
jgi:hypothetical protein